jgi:hypothetical protein
MESWAAKKLPKSTQDFAVKKTVPGPAKTMKQSDGLSFPKEDSGFSQPGTAANEVWLDHDVHRRLPTGSTTGSGQPPWELGFSSPKRLKYPLVI